MGIRVLGLRVGVFRGFEFLGLRVWGLGFGVQGFWVEGFRGFGFRVNPKGLNCRERDSAGPGFSIVMRTIRTTRSPEQLFE